jgi:4-hydroxymandelate oxidase
MPPIVDKGTSRRCFIKFIAGSPLFVVTSFSSFAQAEAFLGSRPDPHVWAPRDYEHLISTPQEALDVFDFEPVMHKNVPPAHFGYMASGVDDDVTLRANREGFLKFQLRPRRLVDVSKIDMGTEILGQKYDTPINRPDWRPSRLPSRRRGRRRARGEGRRSPDDSLDSSNCFGQ